jgi:hypothetical protein
MNQPVAEFAGIRDEGVPSSFRFGIRTLATLTAALALVLALINLLGTLLGLLVSLAVAIIALTSVLLPAIVLHSRMSAAQKRVGNSWVLLLSLATLTLTITLMFAGGTQVAMHFLNERAVKQKYNQQLGFTHSIETHFINDLAVPVVRIETISPGGEFESAGFLPGDVIADREASEFFATLQNSAGEKVDVEVVSSLPRFIAGPLDNLPHRTVTFQVPADQ